MVFGAMYFDAVAAAGPISALQQSFAAGMMTAFVVAAAAAAVAAAAVALKGASEFLRSELLKRFLRDLESPISRYRPISTTSL